MFPLHCCTTCRCAFDRWSGCNMTDLQITLTEMLRNRQGDTRPNRWIGRWALGGRGSSSMAVTLARSFTVTMNNMVNETPNHYFQTLQHNWKQPFSDCRVSKCADRIYVNHRYNPELNFALDFQSKKKKNGFEEKFARWFSASRIVEIRQLMRVSVSPLAFARSRATSPLPSPGAARKDAALSALTPPPPAYQFINCYFPSRSFALLHRRNASRGQGELRRGPHSSLEKFTGGCIPATKSGTVSLASRIEKHWRVFKFFQVRFLALYFVRSPREKLLYVAPTDSLLASHQCKPGSIPGRVTPGFSQMGIMPDDDTGRRVFSGISRFPSPCIPAPLQSHLISPLSTLTTLLFRVVQISQLNSFFVYWYKEAFKSAQPIEHCTSVQSLALSGDCVLDARDCLALIDLRPIGHKRAQMPQVDGYLKRSVKSDEALGVRASVARIAPLLLDLGPSTNWGKALRHAGQRGGWSFVLRYKRLSRLLNTYLLTPWRALGTFLNVRSLALWLSAGSSRQILLIVIRHPLTTPPLHPRRQHPPRGVGAPKTNSVMHWTATPAYSTRYPGFKSRVSGVSRRGIIVEQLLTAWKFERRGSHHGKLAANPTRLQYPPPPPLPTPTGLNQSNNTSLQVSGSVTLPPRLVSRLPRLCLVLELHCRRHDGNAVRLARRSDEALGVRVSVARIAPSLLDLGRGVPTGVRPSLKARPRPFCRISSFFVS
ncbi:hypothetical protein PR048_032258 [Dryococelus australis]|uniref:Uncharacterized protein n=1 Tax=Dryococelus australis TaxID=614101 RepID=A0ABQ9G1Q3_9NEOP|nr:hypothetical protein PR048_032258 [Dryococelus australis]